MKYDFHISRHARNGTTVKILATSPLGLTRAIWEWHGGPDEVDPDPKPIPAYAVNFLVGVMIHYMPADQDPRLEGGSYVIGPDGLQRWVSGPIAE